ncbi:MAG: aminotransferase class V-fold PLP-dependent enzyme [Bryobacterales bacterium]|nr:aminotransferase class V-fold PLP-dependent enzyme [Bryobacterales bacterium]
MISHSLGAMPATVPGAVAEYARQWGERGIRAWEEGWWTMPLTIGDKIARIIGAPPGSVVMQPNVSIAQWMILSCFDWSQRRNRLVSEEMNFPTNLYNFHELTAAGARLHLVPSPDGITIPTEAMLDAIDEETLLVCLSHVLFRSSYQQDLAAITRRAHEVGAMVVADIYQSAGTVPLNVTALRVDFATGGSVKWLCGGPGAGYLYVRPDLVPQLRPKLTGWAAHERPFAFAPGPIVHAPDMARFFHGTPAIPALFAAAPGYDIVHEVGVAQIREKSVRQTQRLIALADEAGLAVRSPREPEQRGGVVVLDVPDGAAVTARVAEQNILVDYRPNAGIRIAPHFYTSDDELDYTIQALRQLMA